MREKEVEGLKAKVLGLEAQLETGTSSKGEVRAKLLQTQDHAEAVLHDQELPPRLGSCSLADRRKSEIAHPAHPFLQHNHPLQRDCSVSYKPRITCKASIDRCPTCIVRIVLFGFSNIRHWIRSFNRFHS